jgi:hypothetical protein
VSVNTTGHTSTTKGVRPHCRNGDGSDRNFVARFPNPDFGKEREGKERELGVIMMKSAMMFEMPIPTNVSSCMRAS